MTHASAQPALRARLVELGRLGAGGVRQLGHQDRRDQQQEGDDETTDSR